MEQLNFWAQLAALGQVIAIDLVLADGNAIVIGMAAAAVPLENRRKVIFWGIGAAISLPVCFDGHLTEPWIGIVRNASNLGPLRTSARRRRPAP
jgi:hypothetical protein